MEVKIFIMYFQRENIFEYRIKCNTTGIFLQLELFVIYHEWKIQNVQYMFAKTRRVTLAAVLPCMVMAEKCHWKF